MGSEVPSREWLEFEGDDFRLISGSGKRNDVIIHRSAAPSLQRGKRCGAHPADRTMEHSPTTDPFKGGVLSVRFVRLSCAADMSGTMSVLSA